MMNSSTCCLLYVVRDSYIGRAVAVQRHQTVLTTQKVRRQAVTLGPAFVM
jgi:hypothetical protein